MRDAEEGGAGNGPRDRQAGLLLPAYTAQRRAQQGRRLKAFCARSVDKQAAWKQQQQRQQQGAEGKMADVPEPVITEIGPWSRNHTGCFLWRSILDAFRLDLFTRFHTLLF